MFDLRTRRYKRYLRIDLVAKFRSITWVDNETALVTISVIRGFHSSDCFEAVISVPSVTGRGRMEPVGGTAPPTRHDPKLTFEYDLLVIRRADPDSHRRLLSGPEAHLVLVGVLNKASSIPE